MEYPNIVVITLEHTNYRSLGCYGNQEVQTPHIDRFARDSLLFETCVVPCPLCVPSRVSFFTGRYPSANRSRWNISLLPPHGVTLPSILAEAGYRCGLFGKNHCFSNPAASGFCDTMDENVMRQDIAKQYGNPFPEPPQSFDSSLLEERQRKFRWSEFPRPIWGSGVYPLPKEEAPSRLNVETAVDFVHQDSSKPFFLWLSFNDPHPPYRCPEPYNTLYEPESLSLPPLPLGGVSSYSDVLQFYYREGCFDLMSESQLRQTMAHYYGMLSYLDDCLGWFLEEMQRPELGNTVIVLTADHGDYMGERGFMRKCAALYDSLVRVPLIVHGLPGMPKGTSQVLTESIDIMPTLLDIAGLPIPPGVQGFSLMDVMGGRAKPRDSVYAETGGFYRDFCTESGRPNLEQYTFSLNHSRMVRTSKYKYIYGTDGHEELYCVEDDPMELHNLMELPEYGETVSELRHILLRRCIEAEDPLELSFG